MRHGQTIGHRTPGENIAFAKKLLEMGIFTNHDRHFKHIRPAVRNPKKEEKK